MFTWEQNLNNERKSAFQQSETALHGSSEWKKPTKIISPRISDFAISFGSQTRSYNGLPITVTLKMLSAKSY